MAGETANAPHNIRSSVVDPKEAQLVWVPQLSSSASSRRGYLQEGRRRTLHGPRGASKLLCCLLCWQAYNEQTAPPLTPLAKPN